MAHHTGTITVTPRLLLDVDRLQHNLQRMQILAERNGVCLRPHIKTAKCAEIARLATGRDGPLTVSTLAEIDYFRRTGFRDFTYAVGITAEKIDRLAPWLTEGLRVAVLLDHPETARMVATRMEAFALDIDVMIEIDCGARRGGLAPEDPALLETARIVDTCPRLHLRGVLSHAGHAYHAADMAALKTIAEQERQSTVQAAQLLRDNDLPCPVVSIGSTPSVLAAVSFEGINEIRPGVYMFMDLKQASLGICTREDIAISVAARIIGHNRHNGQYLVDAGALALSQDNSQQGHGVLAPPHSGRITAVHQEHGFLETGIGAAPLAIGDRVRILPNHACMTAAGHDRYHLVKAGRETGETWERCRGW